MLMLFCYRLCMIHVDKSCPFLSLRINGLQRLSNYFLHHLIYISTYFGALSAHYVERVPCFLSSVSRSPSIQLSHFFHRQISVGLLRRLQLLFSSCNCQDPLIHTHTQTHPHTVFRRLSVTSLISKERPT